MCGEEAASSALSLSCQPDKGRVTGTAGTAPGTWPLQASAAVLQWLNVIQAIRLHTLVSLTQMFSGMRNWDKTLSVSKWTILIDFPL